MNQKQKHDFINNSLKIEIIHKIIEDNITKDQEIASAILNDLLKLYKEQEEILESK